MVRSKNLHTHLFDERELHAARAACGLRSISALARACGLSEGFLRQLAAGRMPGERARKQLEAVLGRAAISRIWAVQP